MAYEAGKEVYESIRQRASMLQPLEDFISKLSGRFTARTDERLLAVIHTLQMRTYKTPLPPSADVPENFKKELTGVCKACGAREPSGAMPTSRIGQYQVQFARDLDPSAPNAPKTLGELCERLKGWRVMLETIMEDLHPTALRLENESPTLVDMLLDDLEMPCQPLPSPDSPDPVYIEKVGSRVEVVRRNCTSARRIVLHGSDGSARAFCIVGQQSSHGGLGLAEERINALLRGANSLLDKHPESRRRGLRFVAPQGLSIYPVRLVEDDPSATPYLDAYDTHCARYGREPDAPIVTFKARIINPDGTTADLAARLEIYSELCKVVNENIFSQYMYKTMVENSRMMWTFKRQFAVSTAMSAIECHLLLLGGRSPGRILVSRATGAITHMDLNTGYDGRFQLERAHETVPFRLTRNMQAFIGPHGFEGTLMAAGAAGAQGLQQIHTAMPSMLALFLRDDILAWAMRRYQIKSVVAVDQILKVSHLEACVGSNIVSAMNRLAGAGPSNSVVFNGNPQLGMRQLVTSATDANNLCRMEPTWQPWL